MASQAILLLILKEYIETPVFLGMFTATGVDAAEKAGLRSILWMKTQIWISMNTCIIKNPAKVHS